MRLPSDSGPPWSGIKVLSHDNLVGARYAIHGEHANVIYVSPAMYSLLLSDLTATLNSLRVKPFSQLENVLKNKGEICDQKSSIK